MGGPIVRSGATPQFSENWDKIFNGKPAAAKSVSKKSSAKPGKSPKKKSPAKAPRKPCRKKCK